MTVGMPSQIITNGHRTEEIKDYLEFFSQPSIHTTIRFPSNRCTCRDFIRILGIRLSEGTKNKCTAREIVGGSIVPGYLDSINYHREY